MVEGKNDEAVTYETSEAGFGSLRIVKGVDWLIYNQRSQYTGMTSITYYVQHDISPDTH